MDNLENIQKYKKIKPDEGQAIIEFALILPILLLILGGIIEFGLLFYNKQVIANASREGARAGTVRYLDASGNKIIPDVNQVVQKYCADKLITFGSPALPQTHCPSLVGIEYPTDLKVKVTYPYKFLMAAAMNVFGADVGPTIEISASTVMRME